MARGAGMNPAATISISSTRPIEKSCVGEGEGVAVRAVVDGTGVVVEVGVPGVVDGPGVTGDVIVTAGGEATVAFRTNAAVSPGGIAKPGSKTNTLSREADVVAVWLAPPTVPIRLSEESTSGSLASIATRVTLSWRSLVLRTSKRPASSVSPPEAITSTTFVASALPPATGVVDVM